MQHIFTIILRRKSCPTFSLMQKAFYLLLVLCLITLTPLSAYAAGDHITSAAPLSLNHVKKFQLEAYDYFYGYFTIPASYDSSCDKISITVNDLSNFSLSVMDSNGSTVVMTATKNTMVLKEKAMAGERYFVKVSNRHTVHSSGSITIQYTTDNHKKTATPKNKKPSPKSTPRSKQASQSKNSSSSKRSSQSKRSSSNKRSSQSKRSSSDRRSSPSNSASSSRRSSTASSASPSSRRSSIGNSTSPSSRRNSMGNSASSSGRRSSMGNSTSPSSRRNSIANSSSPSSRRSSIANSASPSDRHSSIANSTSIPDTHYIRLKKGTSIALAERIYRTPPKHSLKFTASSSSLKIADGIVYAPSAGLFYITIQDGSYSSSCTLKVDE